MPIPCHIEGNQVIHAVFERKQEELAELVLVGFGVVVVIQHARSPAVAVVDGADVNGADTMVEIVTWTPVVGHANIVHQPAVQS